jgi:hypothetical protein
MNKFSKSRALLCSVLALSAVLAGYSGESVVSPSKRQESLDKAKALFADKTATFSSKNPFSPEGFGEGAIVPSKPGNTNVTVPSGPRTPRDLLQAIGSSLKPTGFFVLSGEPTLVFGQKRVKAGGTLTITFEGSEYTVEIISIERPNFTLRLNREEFTRPIK